MKNLFNYLAVLICIVMLLFSCNRIDTVGFDNESVATKDMTNAHSLNVTHQEAQGVADMFLRSEAGSDIFQTKSANAKRVSSSSTVREDGQNLMYVFNYEGGGFVIVSATRNYYPVLAYSDKNSFVLQEDMGPVDVWLDETIVSIKNSSSLDEATKTQMQNMWASYAGTYVDPTQEILATRRPQTRSTGEDYCWDRIDALQALYGSQGWTFLPVSFVEQLFEDAGLSDYYDDICYSATQNHSALNETVIGYKNTPYYTTPVGPLLDTYCWYQRSPFNDLCPPNCPAGCAVIAAAQIVKYYEHAPTYPLQWGTTTFYWSEIADYPDNSSTTRQPHFIQYIASYIPGIDYANYDSGATSNQIKNGMQNLGYTASLQSHNASSAFSQISQGGKPVLMLGVNSDGGGHAWVCDGVKQYIYNYITFFTENQPYGAGTFTQGMYTISNPGTEGGIVIPYYHMKFGAEDGDYDDWYIDNAFSSGCDYQYSRQDIFISYP
ncbi:MAG: C10 family peptidase [Bacteroidales bacterium]|nr:C10 family peptidase [Bacteroidales bacterium]